MAMDYFELPRPDWYDEQGRIYKDRLIENFNAIEVKLQAMREADGADVTEIDFDNLDLPDVTLASEDNKIVNLESYASIMSINDGYPIQLFFNGTKVASCKYMYNNRIISLNNITLSGVANGKFLWFNHTNGTFSVVDGSTVLYNIANAVVGHLVAGYSGGKWIGLHVPVPCDYDILEPLSRMTVKGIQFTDGLGAGSQVHVRENGPGRKIGTTCVNSHGGSMLKLIMPDFGNKKYGQRG